MATGPPSLLWPLTHSLAPLLGVSKLSPVRCCDSLHHIKLALSFNLENGQIVTVCHRPVVQSVGSTCETTQGRLAVPLVYLFECRGFVTLPRPLPLGLYTQPAACGAHTSGQVGTRGNGNAGRAFLQLHCNSGGRRATVDRS